MSIKPSKKTSGRSNNSLPNLDKDLELISAYINKGKSFDNSKNQNVEVIDLPHTPSQKPLNITLSQEISSQSSQKTTESNNLEIFEKKEQDLSSNNLVIVKDNSKDTKNLDRDFKISSNPKTNLDFSSTKPKNTSNQVLIDHLDQQKKTFSITGLKNIDLNSPKKPEDEVFIEPDDLIEISKKTKKYSWQRDLAVTEDKETSTNHLPEDFKSKSQNSQTSFWKIFTSDIFWQGLAFALVLGTVLFYFQTLQPLILFNYIDKAENQVRELNQVYNSQTGQYFQTAGIVDKSYYYNPNLLCTETPDYATFNEDINQVQSLKVNILPNQKFSVLDNYLVFSEPKVESTYLEIYQQYEESLSLYEDHVKELEELLIFSNYRNSWIQACKRIETNNQNLLEVQNACQDLKKSTDTYLQDRESFPELWTFIEDDVQKGLETCNNLSNLEEFFRNWLDSYNNLLSVSPDFEEETKFLAESSLSFQNNSKTALQIFTQTYNSKRDFLEIWYFLEIRY